jgi:hypothetical protein
MTVRELIITLARYDGELEVMRLDTETWNWEALDRVFENRSCEEEGKQPIVEFTFEPTNRKWR